MNIKFSLSGCLFTALMAAGTVSSVAVQAQCFDMTTLEPSSSVRLNDRNIYLVSVTKEEDDKGKTTNHYLYGWNQKVSPDGHPRQTLMTSPATDPLCPQLSVLPPDEQTSLRLASDGYILPTDSAKGEQIYYDWVVTEKKPLLVVKHAAVLETPGHSILASYPRYATPWCRVGVFVGDSLYERLSIDHNPAFPETVKDFTPFTDTNGRDAIWLDWTTDTIDLKEFVGQKITVVLDSRDCALDKWSDNKHTSFVFCTEHHLARLYAHLSCAPLYTYTCEGTFTAPDTVCADAKEFRLANSFTEGTILSYDLRFSDNALAQGFADRSFFPLKNDTASIVIPIPQKEGSYPRPDTYSLSLTLHTRCDNDTVIPISFTLLYPSWVIYQRWNDVVSVANADYNGGYDISSVRWYRDGKEVQGYGEHGAWYKEPAGFVYSSVDAQTGDSVSSVGYTVALTRKGEDKHICSCLFVPVKQEYKTELGNPLINVASMPDGSHRIAAAVAGEYMVYTYMGTLLVRGTIAPDDQVALPSTDVPCIVSFRANDSDITQTVRISL